VLKKSCKALLEIMELRQYKIKPFAVRYKDTRILTIF